MDETRGKTAIQIEKAGPENAPQGSLRDIMRGASSRHKDQEDAYRLGLIKGTGKEITGKYVRAGQYSGPCYDEFLAGIRNAQKRVGPRDAPRGLKKAYQEGRRLGAIMDSIEEAIEKSTKRSEKRPILEGRRLGALMDFIEGRIELEARKDPSKARIKPVRIGDLYGVPLIPKSIPPWIPRRDKHDNPRALYGRHLSAIQAKLYLERKKGLKADIAKEMETLDLLDAKYSGTGDWARENLKGLKQ